MPYIEIAEDTAHEMNRAYEKRMNTRMHGNNVCTDSLGKMLKIVLNTDKDFLFVNPYKDMHDYAEAAFNIMLEMIQTRERCFEDHWYVLCLQISDGTYYGVPRGIYDHDPHHEICLMVHTDSLALYSDYHGGQAGIC